MTTRRAVLAVAALLGAAPVPPLTACGSGPDGDGQPVTVLAAASLRDVLPEVARRHETDRPDTTLRLSFGGSQELVAQVRQGLPADAVVTADTATMDALGDRTAQVRTVAENRLTLVTAPGNPHGLATPADLAAPDLRVVLAAPQVPAGRYARALLADANVHVTPVSEATSVRGVLSAVLLGEADAGVVYATDVAAAGDRVTEVPLADAHRTATTYPAAVLRDAPRRARAADFLAWLGSAPARELLREAGFTLP